MDIDFLRAWHLQSSCSLLWSELLYTDGIVSSLKLQNGEVFNRILLRFTVAGSGLMFISLESNEINRIIPV